MQQQGLERTHEQLGHEWQQQQEQTHERFEQEQQEQQQQHQQQQQQQQQQQLETLKELLELHISNEHVVWPAGMSATKAQTRIRQLEAAKDFEQQSLEYERDYYEHDFSDNRAESHRNIFDGDGSLMTGHTDVTCRICWMMALTTMQMKKLN